MSEPYLKSYTPPTPALEITLRLPESHSLEPIKALIDTGADATIVPMHIIQQLGPQSIETAYLRSPWGERRAVELYILDVQTDNVTVPGVEIVGDHLGQELILGRNVLNKLILHLDGPALTTTVSTR
jgi:predicted aspartyl protease